MPRQAKPRRSDGGGDAGKRAEVGLALAGGGPLGVSTKWGPFWRYPNHSTALTSTTSRSTAYRPVPSSPQDWPTASPRRRCTVFSSTTEAMQHFRPPCSSALHCANSRVAHYCKRSATIRSRFEELLGASAGTQVDGRRCLAGARRADRPLRSARAIDVFLARLFATGQ